jgi:hypothetical protein
MSAAPKIFLSSKNNLAYQALVKPTVHSLLVKTMCSAAIFAALVPSTIAAPFPSFGPMVPGNTACLRFGLACAPANAPLVVKRAIWAANQLRSKPYRFGGGHASFLDSGYDCSGTISYMLGGAGLIRSPMSSSDLRGFGESGCGKWITVYARNGHTFAVIAGLRLDTTTLGQLHRSLGAALANYESDAVRLRSAASGRVVSCGRGDLFQI